MPRRLPAATPGQIRIIGGRWRGRVLRVAGRVHLRPTPSRVRETLFNWLGQRLDGAHCLDLYAGSGALGLEAASRGAESVVLVERDGVTARQLVQSCNALGATQVRIVHAEAMQFVRSARVHYDVVFLDPPFGQNALPAILPLVPALLSPGARVYVEARVGEALPEGWLTVREKRAGQVVYRLLERQDNDSCRLPGHL